MDKNPVVLIVEDDEVAQLMAEAALLPHAEVLIAGSLHKASNIIRSRPDIAYIILDGRVPNFENEPLRVVDTTHDLVWDIERFLPGATIYSASSEASLNDELVEIGCIRATKNTAPGMVVADILNKKKT